MTEAPRAAFVHSPSAAELRRLQRRATQSVISFALRPSATLVFTKQHLNLIYFHRCFVIAADIYQHFGGSSQEQRSSSGFDLALIRLHLLKQKELMHHMCPTESGREHLNMNTEEGRKNGGTGDTKGYYVRSRSTALAWENEWLWNWGTKGKLFPWHARTNQVIP